jgi:catechol 2,3-dioxygenase-like lactoylglutathione lyase family enzyme
MPASTIPILPSSDLDATAEFYGILGFDETGRWPGYLILEHRASVELHFFHQPGLVAATNDHGCYVRFSSDLEAESVYNQWLAAGLPAGHLHAPEATDYGLLEFALLDLDRNLVRVGGVIDG